MLTHVYDDTLLLLRARDMSCALLSSFSHDRCHGVANRGESKAAVEDPGRDRVVARGGLPRFEALRRDNTPTPAYLYICVISGTWLLLELY